MLDAPPRLQVPVAEPAALQLAAVPEVAALLRALFGPSLPIQISDPEFAPPRTGVSAESAAGDPATLLSLMLDAQRMREFLSVPAGNQLGRLPEGGKSGAITAAAPGAGSGGRGGSEGNGAGGADAASAVAADAAGGTSAQPEQPHADAGNPSDETANGGSGGGMRAAALAAAAATRIVHPASGVFDVVVQSAGVEGFPESAGVLSGKPVYSVFVAAGAPKDWILQYCIPAEDDHTMIVAGPVVRLGTPSRVSAPWPRLTMRPALRQRPGKYVMVHGMITAAGRFEGLRVLGGTEPQEAELAVAVLDKWEFRPAMRDGAAIRVEVLLAIPAE